MDLQTNIKEESIKLIGVIGKGKDRAIIINKRKKK